MKKLFLIAFATLLSVGSYAAEGDAVSDKKPLGLYVGVGLGAKVSSTTDYKVPYALPDLFPASKSDINLFVGYNIMKYLAVELELNAGLKVTKKDSASKTLEDTFMGTTIIADGSTNLKQTYHNESFLLNVVGKYPILDKHIPFIKLGIGSMKYTNKYKQDSSVSGSIGAVNGTLGSYHASVDLEDTGLAYKFAVGYEYAITQNHSVLLAFNYNMVPSVDYKETLSESLVPNPSIPGSSPTHESYVAKENNIAKTTYSTINISYKFTF